jgi:DNA-binding phage protein
MPRGTNITPEERQAIVDLYKQGINMAQIAERTGRSWSTVVRILDKEGIRGLNAPTVGDDEIKLMLSLAKEHLPLTEIAKKTGRCRETIARVLLKQGVDPYWQYGREKPVKVKKKAPVKQPETTLFSPYGGFTSCRTGAHYFIRRGYMGRYYVVYEGAAFHGILSDHGYGTPDKAREVLEYLKNLFEAEGVACIYDVQERQPHR